MSRSNAAVKRTLWLIEALAHQGVERVLISPSSGDLDELRGSLEKFGKEIAESFAD